MQDVHSSGDTQHFQSAPTVVGQGLSPAFRLRVISEVVLLELTLNAGLKPRPTAEGW